ncbi:MAG: hypothetical protein OXQ29_00125 [Rhodospirillaceae bacterium]|nr:hypothetical protein [Rhodospirillaceae bacterium]
MLSMKTLRVAIMTMGSALLLGPMLAQAERVNLSGGTADGLGPLTYAQETLSSTANTTTGRWAVEMPTAGFQIAVKPRRAINATEEVYLRIDLTGARFGAAPTLEQGPLADADGDLTTDDFSAGLTGTLSSGGAGQTFAVLKIGAAGAGADVAAANSIAVVITTTPAFVAGGDLQLTSADAGSVTATIAAYTNPDDALDQVNAKSTFGGSGTILRVMSGLTVTIDAADSMDAGPANAVASVDHGFLWFVGPTGQAKLGWLGVEANVAATAGIRNATSGAALNADGTEILPSGSQVEFQITGNLDIGAFSLIDDTNYDPAPGAASSTTACPGATATANAPDQGTLRGEDGMLLVSEEGELPSGVEMASSGNLAPNTTAGTRARLLCVNVDVMGPATNMNPIPEGSYSAMAFTKTSATAMGRMVGEGDLASISHNGASVDIPYLTTSEKHNQRLIVVNRGTRPAAITSIQFTTEDGTEVELMDTVQAAMDAGLLMVPAGQSWVARMDETINITGDSRRVAASIAFAATAGHLSVATTQVNVSDGSTDTVVYTVD